MTFSGDPYRILGLAQGASLDDVKRAYRRMAKRYHPDAAGPDAVERFLLIQGAYEAIAGPAAHGAGRGQAVRRSSAADPDRARATREAYRARASGPWGRRATDGWPAGTGADTGGAGAAGSPGAGGTWSPGAGAARGFGARSGPEQAKRTARGEGPGRTEAGGSERAGAERRRSDTRPRSDTPPRGAPPRGDAPPRRPPRRKATLSSTSYDDAAREPRQPEWQGSSWYGTSSGTYWTINPREYADPRKHGPEYQARARRAAAEGREDPGVAAWTVRQPPGGEGPAGDASGSSASSDGGPLPGRSAPSGDSGWRAAGTDRSARTASAPADHPRREKDAVASEPRPSRVQTAGSIGLASGAVAAIPAAVVVLGSTMAGDLSLAALALAVPAVVALGVGVAVGLSRRR